ncbi:sterol homeostasis protein [Malassezia nana]|uniref:Protein ARV n=1 Tax=Malassezia nana TaxID=180528 RepID=A0AAF0J1J3_9BASI|nr:sterol homeostasis protein [Malassezia nana]
MPVCVYCARPVPALVARFGSGHIALARCAAGCGRIADPYLEYGHAILVIDLILIKPRVYRHLLYNIAPIQQHALRHTSYTLPLHVHARRLVALVLVESYLAWFTLCVHPWAMEPTSAWTSSAYGRSWLPAPLIGAARVACATFLHMLALHATVVIAGRLVQGVWHRYRGANAYPYLYPWYLPSVAMLYASLSTELLLVIRLVWDSRMPADRRATAQPSLLAPLQGIAPYVPGWLASGPWHTDLFIRHILGGMSAGVALAATWPIPPLISALVALLGFAVQAHVRAWLGLPDVAHGPAALCKP